MSLAPMKESEKSAWAVEYGRRINCDLTRAILEELLWDVADQVMAGIADGHGTVPQEAPDRTNFAETKRLSLLSDFIGVSHGRENPARKRSRTSSHSKRP